LLVSGQSTSVSLSQAITLGTSGGAISNGNSTYGLTLSGVISGSGLFTVNSGISSGSQAGTVILTGSNSYTGATTITAGTLQVGAGGTTGTLGTGSINNSGTLSFNETGTVTVSNVISGTGALTQFGSGTLVLSGTNTYTGATTVSGGTLQLNAAANLGNTSGITVNGASLLVSGQSVAVTLTQAISVGVNGGAISNVSSAYGLTLSGVISGGGDLAFNTGTQVGTVILTGTNTYTGNTSIDSGTLGRPWKTQAIRARMPL
jgi:fibronectin-binding autotransporter adhesin